MSVEGARREGFQPPRPVAATFDRPAPPRPQPTIEEQPEAPPQQLGPQDVLPSQLVNEPPVLEPPLSEAESARREIAASPEAWPVTVELLYKPVRNLKGEVLYRLTFSEPTAGVINRVGNPTRMLWDGEIVIEERKMTHIMAALANLPAQAIEMMDPRDWNSCAYRLRKFFLPDLRGW
jgi:hypothetical protein